ncbi:MAG: S8 family serine peptidase [Gammaproteobacteria bacterium]|nr:S8 family serine peptidase [Gammaproteobacteria bacterium]
MSGKNNNFMLRSGVISPVLKHALLLASLLGILSGCFDKSGDSSPKGGDSSPKGSTLSGTVSSAAGSVADSDINDPNAPYVANDTPDQAQPIPNPVMLGGYVNVAGTGYTGRSYSSGDRVDFFSISLAANQNITLNIADHTTGDLDLYLYKDDGSIDLNNPDNMSRGTGKTETLTVAEAGNYIIEVYAFNDTDNPNDGYSNYALVVGQNAQDTAAHTTGRLVLTDNFVPGEIIVRFRDDALSSNASRAPTTRAASLGLQAKAGADNRAMLLGLGDLQARQASFRTLGITAKQKNADPLRQFRSADPEKQLKMDTLQVIKALRKRNDVLYAGPNYIYQAQLEPTDPYYKFQWHYPLINLPGAWDVSTGDANVIVAVIDSGVLLNHPDLSGQFSGDGGYDFIRDNAISQDGEPGIDNNPDDPGDKAAPGGRSSFHGTHVAGTIAAATSFGGGGTGVAGIAPGVKIMPLRVLGVDGGTGYDIFQAIRYAAGLSNDSGTVPAQKADIMNLSLGGGPFIQEMQNLITQIRNEGMVIVAAAGNSRTGTLAYPASYDGVISVSAVDINKQLAGYSNFGAAIDVSAPGGNTARDINGDGRPDGVLSTIGDDSGNSIKLDVYSEYQGTSMAAPHMAGVVALMKSVYSNLTPANVDSLLSSGKIVQDLGTPGRDDQFGHGLIDARKAVDEAALLTGAGSTPDTPFLNVSPVALNFGNSETSLSLSMVNGDSGELTITSVDDDAAWLTVTANSVDATTQLGSYQVSIDRTGLATGTYTANITIVSSANSVTVPVIQQVGDSGVSSTNAGYQYILLLNADNGEPVQQWTSSAQNGSYNFQFNNVDFSAGQNYLIITGTDQNNDNIICDAGEACGAYITQVQPKTITTDDKHSGLNFTTGFNVGLQNQRLSTTAGPLRGIAIRRLSGKQAP